MRYVFLIIMVFHGLIHLMGFTKAFELVEVRQLSQPISKPMGLVWLLAAILFIITVILSLLKKDGWSILAIIAVVVSQILIIVFWKDAKFGTLANIVILCIGIPAFGKYRFEKMARQEVLEILQQNVAENTSVIDTGAIRHLPPIVQKWMEFSSVIGKPKTLSVRLRQKGELKTESDGKWMPFAADQYFNTYDPSFVWVAHVKANALMYMDGRDKLQKGEGAMLIKLFSLFTVVDESQNEKIDSGNLQRYLAEVCWFPSASLNDYISWEVVSENSAKATLKHAGKDVSGIFEFDGSGKMLSFQTERHHGGGKNAKLETWFIEMLDFKEFEGIKIPYKCKVTWKLKEGDFSWLHLEITDLEYNINELW